MTQRYLLDTNIISDALRPRPDPLLAGWMASHAGHELFTSSIVLGEVWQGIRIKPDGAKKRALLEWFEGPAGPRRLFAGRMLLFDEAASLQWAEFMAEGRRAGRPRSVIDMQIAATAKVNGCAVVTLNLVDFAPVQDEVVIVDPRRQAGNRA